MADIGCNRTCPVFRLLRWLVGVGSMDTARGWALFPLRMVMFAMFFEHGAAKLLNFSERAVGAAKMAGFPETLWTFLGVCLILAELGGAFLMLIGVGVRLAAFLQGFVVVVILSTVKARVAFSMESMWFYMALAICIALFVLGNGRPTLLPGSGRELDNDEQECQ